MSKNEKQSMFKIVSLTKYQPIFLFKQLENSVNTRLLRDQTLNSVISQKQKVKKTKSDLSRLQLSTNGLNPVVKSYLQRRIQSCSFNQKGKTEPRHLNSQDQEKTQKIIKEYLKLAYKKAQTDRRAQAYKLPIIGCQSITRSQRKKDDNTENNADENKQGKAISHLKLSKRRSLHRHQHNEQHLLLQQLSGWDLHPAIEDF